MSQGPGAVVEMGRGEASIPVKILCRHSCPKEPMHHNRRSRAAGEGATIQGRTQRARLRRVSCFHHRRYLSTQLTCLRQMGIGAADSRIYLGESTRSRDLGDMQAYQTRCGSGATKMQIGPSPAARAWSRFRQLLKNLFGKLLSLLPAPSS